MYRNSEITFVYTPINGLYTIFFSHINSEEFHKAKFYIYFDCNYDWH